MTMSTRNPTEVAECGCPYDPEYDEGHLGWHLAENHIPETISHIQGVISSLAEEVARLRLAICERTDVYETFYERQGDLGTS